MISPNRLEVGSVVFYQNKFLKIQSKEHVKLAKGGACQKLKCLNILGGGTSEIRVNVNDHLQDVYVEHKKIQFSYIENETMHCFDEDYQNLELPASVLDEATLVFLGNYQNQANCSDLIEFDADFIEVDGNSKCISLRLASDVTVSVDKTNVSIKGETITSSYKPAIACGIQIQVPPHVNENDQIILSKKDLSYLRKV